MGEANVNIKRSAQLAWLILSLSLSLSLSLYLFSQAMLFIWKNMRLHERICRLPYEFYLSRWYEQSPSLNFKAVIKCLTIFDVSKFKRVTWDYYRYSILCRYIVNLFIHFQNR